MRMLLAYRAYFTQHPPTHLLMAGFVGFKPTQPRATGAPITPAFEELPDIEE